MKRRAADAGIARGWSTCLGFVIGLAGCGPTVPPAVDPATALRGVKLVAGVVGDPAPLGSVAAQRGEWTAQTGSELALRDRPVDPGAIPGEVDVLVFPAERLGDLVEAKALAVLPESVVTSPLDLTPDPDAVHGDPADRPDPPRDRFKPADAVEVFRKVVGKYGPDRYGLPIGGSALVVAFRRSAFTDPGLIEAARAAGVALEPPTTWEQFDALARFFQGRDLDGDGRPDHGVALPWGADPEGVGDAVFLARTIASALHPDQYSFLLDSETTEPRVATPPFVAALGALVGLVAAGPPGAETFDAPAARAAFRTGRVAMLVDRAEAAASWGDGKTPIGVAPLPGSTRIFDPSRSAWESVAVPSRPSYLPVGGGWLIGVVAGSKQVAAATAFARYLAGPDVTNRLRAERDFPMLAVWTAQLAQGMPNPRSAPGVEPRSWADAVTRTLTAPKVFPGLRIPGATGYLADLGRARVAAVGGRPVEPVLRELAEAWAKRTEALGLARQTWHHRRSLIGPSTAAEPPPR